MPTNIVFSSGVVMTPVISRRTKFVALDGRAMGGNGRIAGEGEDVPREVWLAEIVVVRPCDDVAVHVVGAWMMASTGGRAEPAVVVPSGLLLDSGVVPRRLLFVSVAIAVSASGNVSIHSGRSIIVAPTASAAPRVLMRMSFSVQVTRRTR
jgi:hypothetical protein